MKKRLSLLVLVMCLALVLCSCSESSSSFVTLDDTPPTELEANDLRPNQILIFSTRNDIEYLEFLTDLGPQYEIVDISTGMSTNNYGESYMVTYKTSTEKDVARSYKYYLYKTRIQSEYIAFYNMLDLAKLEIVDISTSLSRSGVDESYVITYRSPI